MLCSSWSFSCTFCFLIVIPSGAKRLFCLWEEQAHTVPLHDLCGGKWHGGSLASNQPFSSCCLGQSRETRDHLLWGSMVRRRWKRVSNYSSYLSILCFYIPISLCHKCPTLFLTARHQITITNIGCILLMWQQHHSTKSFPIMSCILLPSNIFASLSKKTFAACLWLLVGWTS
jgi:hypothetical protein